MIEKQLQSLTIGNVAPSREMINKLQDIIMSLPQVEPITEHYFSDGMYCRRVWRPKDTVVVGKIHKKDHLFMCVQGEVIAWTESGMRVLKPGDIVQSKAGTKRVTLALEDSICVTVHRTDKTDLQDVEDELIESEDNSLFSAGNKLKALGEIE